MQKIEFITIGFDIDGVLANFNHTFLTLLNKEFSIDIKCALKKQTHWDHQDCLPVTKEQISYIWDEYIHKSFSFWKNIPMIENELKTRNSIHKLVSDLFSREKREAIIYFVTNRPYGCNSAHQTQYWIHRKLNLAFPNVILCNSRKGDICKALNIDYFIDDKPENCEDILLNSPRTKVYVYNSGYNELFDLCKRVYSVSDYVDEILKERK